MANLTKTQWVTIPDLFRTDTRVVEFVPSKEAWLKETKRFDLETEAYPKSAARCLFVHNEEYDLVLVTVNEDYDKDPFQITALLLHESVHVKQWLMELIGETKPSEEFEAYTVQFIYQQLIEAYEKTRGKLFRDA